ncbi:Alpha/Beta hydrolase protein [Lophiotrema nucula]|uniref:Alpha/Beta hydrolase protein n=1 Tax=Lophiotrema nucula TaxID=690887 RepID=A0A6A5ZT66_9PLEO|nr:Alpha/Beta hydrolase protein [Lophiotrema nucula]
MATLIFLLLAVLTNPVFTAPTHPSPHEYPHPANGVCTDYTIKEEVTWTRNIWGLPKIQNNYDVAVQLMGMANVNKEATYHPFSGSENVTSTYELSGTFCSPTKKRIRKEETVLLATHGGGFDRRYWTSSHKPEEYNFVEHALDNGYSVFYYDRLGLGLSPIISGYEAQASNQVELLAKIAHGIRSGKYTGQTAATKIVLVGHSLGSFFSNGAIAKYPDLAEGLVVTGFSYPNATDPARITLPISQSFQSARLDSTRGDAYFGFGDIYGLTVGFFHEPLDIPTIEYTLSISQPVAIGELTTAEAITLASPKYKGKVLIAAGEYDLILCGGYCADRFKYGVQKDVFPGAKIETYLHPSAGHGLNFAANASVFYDRIIDFVDRNL